jgi:two-component system OmpR family response regulator
MYQLMQRPGAVRSMSHRDQRGSRRDSPVEKSTRILIVDNDRSVATSLTLMLASRGYDDVRAVRSARRAVVLAEQFNPGLVFLDIELPDDGALEVAASLRKGARQHALRLIALTSSQEHEKRDEARIAGFERFMVKPLTQIELDKILRRPPATTL